MTIQTCIHICLFFKAFNWCKKEKINHDPNWEEGKKEGGLGRKGQVMVWKKNARGDLEGKYFNMETTFSLFWKLLFSSELLRSNSRPTFRHLKSCGRYTYSYILHIPLCINVSWWTTDLNDNLEGLPRNCCELSRLQSLHSFTAS